MKKEDEDHNVADMPSSSIKCHCENLKSPEPSTPPTKSSDVALHFSNGYMPHKKPKPIEKLIKEYENDT